jgi:superfamily II DNA or RNA helicase
MNKPKIIKVNESFSKLLADSNTCKLVHNKLRMFDPRAPYNPLFKKDFMGRRKWDGYVSLFDLSNDLIPNGLLFPVIKALENNVTLDKSVPDLYSPVLLEWKHIPCKYEPKPHQVRLIEAAIKKRRAVLESATNSGKSLSLYLLACASVNSGRKVLIVVPSELLIGQLISDFLDYSNGDFKIEGLSGVTKPSKNFQCIVSTWQSGVLQDRQWLAQFDTLFVDECHAAKADKLTSLCNACVNANFRLGLTGSVPKDQLLKKKVEANFGPTISIVDSKELIDVGFSSQLYYRQHVIKHETDLQLNFDGELKFAGASKVKLDHMVALASELGQSENVLILFKTLKMCEKVAALLGAKVITGSRTSKADRAERKETITALDNSEKGQIVCATYGCMSTGVSVKELNHLIQGEPVGADDKVSQLLIQTIGRIARVSKTKNTAIIHDYVDEFQNSSHLKNQSKKRVRLYQSKHVLPWVENIL